MVLTVIVTSWQIQTRLFFEGVARRQDGRILCRVVVSYRYPSGTVVEIPGLTVVEKRGIADSWLAQLKLILEWTGSVGGGYLGPNTILTMS